MLNIHEMEPNIYSIDNGDRVLADFLDYETAKRFASVDELEQIADRAITMLELVLGGDSVKVLRSRLTEIIN